MSVKRGAYSSSFFCVCHIKKNASNYSPEIISGDDYYGKGRSIWSIKDPKKNSKVNFNFVVFFGSKRKIAFIKIIIIHFND